MKKKSKLPHRIVVRRTTEQATVVMDTMPDFVLDRMCKTLLGSVDRFFQNPAVQEDYQRWLQEREAEAK